MLLSFPDGIIHTGVSELRAFRRLEKEMQYLIVMSVTDLPRAFHYWRYKAPQVMVRNKSARELPENISWRGRTGSVTPQA